MTNKTNKINPNLGIDTPENTFTAVISDHTNKRQCSITLPGRFRPLFEGLKEWIATGDAATDPENGLPALQQLSKLFFGFTEERSDRFTALCMNAKQPPQTLGDLIAAVLTVCNYRKIPAIDSPYLLAVLWVRWREHKCPEEIIDLTEDEYPEFGEFLTERYDGIFFRGDFYYQDKEPRLFRHQLRQHKNKTTQKQTK